MTTLRACDYNNDIKVLSAVEFLPSDAMTFTIRSFEGPGVPIAGVYLNLEFSKTNQVGKSSPLLCLADNVRVSESRSLNGESNKYSKA